MKNLLYLSFIALFALSGCNAGNDTGGNNFMNTSNELPGRTMSDQNPNLVNTGSERNQGREIEKARQVIINTKEFTPDSIWINGNDLLVSVNTRNRLSAQEKEDTKKRIHVLLMKALPRYDVKVTVHEG